MAWNIVYVSVTAADRFDTIETSKADLLCGPTTLSELNVRNTDRGARRRVIFNPWVRLFKSLWLLAKM